MPKVTFKPSGQECEAKVGDTLLKVANREKAGIKFSCGGVPSCAMCRVGIVSGEEHLSPIERKETDLMGNTYFLTKQRLSCQAKIISEGDLVLDVSEHTDIPLEPPKQGDTYDSSFRKPKEQWRLTKEEEEKQKQKAKPERRRRPRNQRKGKGKAPKKSPEKGGESKSDS